MITNKGFNMDLKAKIYVAGCQGLVGSALANRLRALGYTNLLLPSKKQCDLANPDSTMEFFIENEPEYVFVAAAKVGGIVANSESPVDFGIINTKIAINVLRAAHALRVNKLIFLGSSCIYPRICPQPIREEYLLTGHLEPTNEMYAIAKIFSLKLCDAYRQQHGCNFISAMPCNLFGPRDNFNLTSSHVIPALMRKVYEAKTNKAPTFTVWGTGSPLREFLYADDLADACIFLMQNYNQAGTVNVGTGIEVSIKQLAELMCEVVGYEGQLVFDTSKPDGTPRKVLDISKIKALGWSPTTTLRSGLEATYKWFTENYHNLRK